MLLSTSYKTKAVNLEASFVYSLASHPLNFVWRGEGGGAPTKCVKSKLYDTALKDLHLTESKHHAVKNATYKLPTISYKIFETNSSFHLK